VEDPFDPAFLDFKYQTLTCIVKRHVNSQYQMVYWSFEIREGSRRIEFESIAMTWEIIGQIPVDTLSYQILESLQHEAHEDFYKVIDKVFQAAVHDQKLQIPHSEDQLWGYGTSSKEYHYVVPGELTDDHFHPQDNDVELHHYYDAAKMQDVYVVTYYPQGIKDPYKKYEARTTIDAAVMAKDSPGAIMNLVFYNAAQHMNSAQKTRLADMLKAEFGYGYEFNGQMLSSAAAAAANSWSKFAGSIEHAHTTFKKSKWDYNYTPKPKVKPAFSGGKPSELKLISSMLSQTVDLPCDCPGQVQLENGIIHLNDSHRWTREAIADWLDELHIKGVVDTTIKSPNEDKA
jgi:hypothetical protein